MASTGTEPPAPLPDQMPDHPNRATKPAATTPRLADIPAMITDMATDMAIHIPMPTITPMIMAVTITTTPRAPAVAYSARHSR
jgi:hypothetical protein